MAVDSSYQRHESQESGFSISEEIVKISCKEANKSSFVDHHSIDLRRSLFSRERCESKEKIRIGSKSIQPTSLSNPARENVSENNGKSGINTKQRQELNTNKPQEKATET